MHESLETKKKKDKENEDILALKIQPLYCAKTMGINDFNMHKKAQMQCNTSTNAEIFIIT